jgi:MFS family permease
MFGTRWRRRRRSRTVGAASVLGAMLGFFLAGKILVWTGRITLGVTPNHVTLGYWPAFVVGIILGAAVCSGLARLVMSRLHQDEA